MVGENRNESKKSDSVKLTRKSIRNMGSKRRIAKPSKNPQASFFLYFIHLLFAKQCRE